MKKKLVFATNNAHKLTEVRAMVGEDFEILSLNDIGCHADIPETADTLQGNAVMKARFVRDNYGLDCFADDSGLEVEALGGAPGVHSARYATDGHDHRANIAKLLREMDGQGDRRARFRTVIALMTDAGTLCFEGEVRGEIMTEEHGTNGFGYDPVFRPEGHEETFAEMTDDEKNAISHRARAVAKLVAHLKTIKP
ncbi:MAG TPA: non-canonical purine NTP diphosphatase [Candidatus Avibacteroides faecavium]|nr:non-canonical purine NTP diphosphatase [Candidatus Avibacteroides faecavium]